MGGSLTSPSEVGIVEALDFSCLLENLEVLRLTESLPKGFSISWASRNDAVSRPFDLLQYP